MNLRIIAHLDMDAFFAAVEERDNPRYRGKPIVIGADPKGGTGRGVVSTANYPARKYGIGSAMPIGRAWERAEAGRLKGGEPVIFLAGNFSKYGKVSAQVMEVLKQYSSVIEKASIDEAYIDLSHAKSFKKARSVAKGIKSEIKKKLNLTASIGIGPNKLMAKIASDMDKPDGLTIITPDEAQEVISTLPIRRIPGIGPKAEQKLNSMGIGTVEGLVKLSEYQLKKLFGSRGGNIYRKARGIDDSPLSGRVPPKSIGEQETFSQDTRDMNYIVSRVKSISSDVMERFQNSGFAGFKGITITVRFEDFTTRNRSLTLDDPADSSYDLAFQALNMVLPFMDSRENPEGKEIRLIGVRIEKFQSAFQLHI